MLVNRNRFESFRYEARKYLAELARIRHWCRAENRWVMFLPEVNHSFYEIESEIRLRSYSANSRFISPLIRHLGMSSGKMLKLSKAVGDLFKIINLNLLLLRSI